MTESNYDGVEVRMEYCNRDRDNYDRLLSIFHTGTEVKRCLLDHFLRGKTLNLFDWLTSLDQNFLHFEDVQRAVRRKAVIEVTDLESSTINTLLRNNCFLMFWDICFPNNKLKDILNSHKAVLYSIYKHADSNQTFSSFSKPRLSTTQWELLFKIDDQLGNNKETYCHSMFSSKDITLSSLDNELNFVLLYTICPLFKSVDVVSECQIQITKIAVSKSELKKPAFDEIWDTIEMHIQIIASQFNLSDYFKQKCEKILHNELNRTVSQDSRKCILEDAFKIPDLIKDNGFCYCVRTELDDINCEGKLNLARILCGREIIIPLLNGNYTQGAYPLGVLEQADKDMDIRKSVCCRQMHSAAQDDIKYTLQIDDIHEGINKHSFLKLVQLIIYIGKDVLVDVLKARLPDANFGYAFNGMKNRIFPLLNNHGRQLLYPDISSYTGDLSDLDISIIYTILRNLNTISPPVNEWGNNPRDDDRSVSANIERMRIFKNIYVSHCSKSSLNENDFHQIWKNIRQCIIELGGTTYERKIDTLFTSEINPLMETELCNTYTKLKETERQNEIDYLKIKEDLNEIKQHLCMTKPQQSDSATTHNGSLGNVPLELRIAGDNLPSAQEITNHIEDLQTKDVRITFAKEGSIVIGLDVSPSAFYSVGKFLEILDSLLSSLLQMHPKYGNGHTSHLVVFVNFMDKAKDVLQRWEILQASMMDRNYRMNQHHQDLGQFKADLDHMLAWLDEVEANQASQISAPRDITQLDSIIRQHKDFLVQLESKKARVLSLNLTSKNFTNLRTQEGRELRDKLRHMNKRWEAICDRANLMQNDLKISLIHCEEFHITIHDLLLWLKSVETKVQQCEPINRGADESALPTKLRKLKELKLDMETNQPRVQSLKQTADQLLINDDSAEMLNAKDKTHIISNRLRTLLRLCKSYIVSLEERLNVSPDVASPPLSLDLTDSRLSSYTARTSTPGTRYKPLRPGSSVRTRSPFAVTRQKC